MLLGIDVGTSSVKVSLLDPETGRCAATSSAPEGEIARMAPSAGWTEQNPEDWWDATKQALHQIPAELRRQVTAIGIGGQMHGLVLLDDSGRPVRPSIIWSDGRSTECGKSIAAELSAPEAAGLLNEPGNFTMAKLRWVRENEPENFALARTALLPEDYIAYCLTREKVTTSTGLSEMIAWDFASRQASDAA